MRKFGSSSIWKLENLKMKEFKNSSHSVGLDLSNEMYSTEIDASVSNSSGLTYNKQGIIAFEMEAKKRYFRWSYSLCTFGYRDIAAYRVSCEMVAEGKTARRHLQTSKEICPECSYLNVFVVCLEFVSYSFRGFLFSFLSDVMSFFFYWRIWISLKHARILHFYQIFKTFFSDILKHFADNLQF